MRSSSTERRGPGRALTVLTAGALGAVIGLALPGVGQTGAVLTGSAATTATVGVSPCSGSYVAHVAALGAALHWDLATGDVAAPGLLACSPTGAMTLAGGVEQGVTGTGPTLATSSTGAMAIWFAVTDGDATGELASLRQADGHAVELRLDAGLLVLRERPAGGGGAVTLLQVAVSTGTRHLVSASRAGGTVTLALDGTVVGAAPLAADPSDPATFTLGAAPGSGLTAAAAVVDEAVVLPGALDASDAAALFAAERW